MLKNAILVTITVVGLSAMATSLAQASSLDLPEYAPVPIFRGDALAEVDQARITHLPVVQISTTPEEIPAERQNVRIVGTRFLPPVDSTLALKDPDVERNGLIASIESASVWVLKTASAGLFGEAVAGQDQTVASLESN